MRLRRELLQRGLCVFECVALRANAASPRRGSAVLAVAEARVAVTRTAAIALPVAEAPPGAPLRSPNRPPRPAGIGSDFSCRDDRHRASRPAAWAWVSRCSRFGGLGRSFTTFFGRRFRSGRR